MLDPRHEGADFPDDFCRFVQACVPSVEVAERRAAPGDPDPPDLRPARPQGIAFVLFALNQLLSAALLVMVEPDSLVYILRVLGFVLIIGAIVDKNLYRR